MIERDGRTLVEGPTGKLVIPRSVADVLAWILARPRLIWPSWMLSFRASPRRIAATCWPI